MKKLPEFANELVKRLHTKYFVDSSEIGFTLFPSSIVTFLMFHDFLPASSTSILPPQPIVTCIPNCNVISKN